MVLGHKFRNHTSPTYLILSATCESADTHLSAVPKEGRCAAALLSNHTPIAPLTLTLTLASHHLGLRELRDIAALLPSHSLPAPLRATLGRGLSPAVLPHASLLGLWAFLVATCSFASSIVDLL